jgi:hypothetical protein
MHSSLNAGLYAARAEELQAAAQRQRAGAEARRAKGSRPDLDDRIVRDDAVTIRWATGQEAVALLRLAELDSHPPLRGRVLVAEVDGELRAAIAPDSGEQVADPFHPSGELTMLLGARARQLRERPRLRAVARRLAQRHAVLN